MTALVRHEVGPFTIADWHALPAREDGSRLELIEGYWLVTPPPSGQHQAASLELLIALRNGLRRSSRDDLHVVGAVGVEIGTMDRTALIPDVVVLNTRPVGASFHPENVLLVGEIWSPGNTNREQVEKFDAFAQAGVPYFWSIAQDLGGPAELAAYRLEDGRYQCETIAKLGDGPVNVTASPVPVEVDLAALRP